MGICLIIKSGGGIDTSAATATADKILSGHTIYSNDNKVTGSMTNWGNQCKSDTTWGNSNGAWVVSPGNATGIYKGWHDGTCSISVESLAAWTSADIPDASWCLYSYTYWKNGTKYTGTMGNQGTKTWTIGVNGEQKIDGGWHSGSGTVKQSSNVTVLDEWKLMRPTTSNQTLCNSGWYYSQNRWCEGASTLTKDNIKKDITIFGITGTYYETKRWVVQNGALCSGISLERVYGWYPDEGSNSFGYLENASATSVSINNTTYIKVDESETVSNDSTSYSWWFSNVGGNLFNYTGSSASDWKLPVMHLDYANWGYSGSKNSLWLYYIISKNSTAFNKRLSQTISGSGWSWYTGSITASTVLSTTKGCGYQNKTSPYINLKTGSINVSMGGGLSTTYFAIRNLWFDTSTYV